MYVMLEKARSAGIVGAPGGPGQKSQPWRLTSFPGSKEWFGRIDYIWDWNKGVSMSSTTLYLFRQLRDNRGYSIASAERFTRIYASKFLYDANDGFADMARRWPSTSPPRRNTSSASTRARTIWNDRLGHQQSMSPTARSSQSPSRTWSISETAKPMCPASGLVKDLGGLSIAVYANGGREIAAEQYRSGRSGSTARGPRRLLRQRDGGPGLHRQVLH